MFSKGKTVEVSLEEFRDVWFPATVVEEIENDSFLVDYPRPGSYGTTKVIVDLLHIRLSPPHLKDKNFSLLETVDAFFDFGWWSGLITEKLDDNKYMVFLKAKRIVRELNHSEIRPHVDWKNGSWFSASQDILILSEYQEFSRNESSRTVTVNSEGRMRALPSDCDEARFLPCQLNTNPMDLPNEDAYNSFTTSTSGDTRTSSSDQSLVDALPSIEAFNFSRIKGPRTKRHKVGVLHRNLTPDPLTRNGGRPPISPLSGKQASTGGENPGGELENQIPNPLKRRVGRPSKLPISSAQGDKTGEIDNNTPNPLKMEVAGPSKSGMSSRGASAGEGGGVRHTRASSSGMSSRGASAGAKNDHALNSEGGGVRRTRASSSLNVLEGQNQQLRDLSAEKVKEGNQVQGGEESTLKRKRGRPPKFPVKTPEASAAVSQQNRGVSAEDMVVENIVGSPTTAGMEVTKELMNSVSVGEKVMELKNKSSSTVKVPPVKKNKQRKRKHFSSNRGGRRTISVNTESPIQDPRDISVRKNPEVNEKDTVTEVERPVNQSPKIVSDDQPILMWLGDVSQGKTVEQCPVVEVMGGSEPVEDQIFPFVKENTGIWKTIEADEAFQKFPQKPHFRSLESSNEAEREGLALCYMISFTSVVKKISRLTFDGPRSLIENNLDTLLKLENNGFEVNKLREHLTKLLLMKDKEEELQEHLKETKCKIEESNEEKTKFDEKIVEINKKMVLLEEEHERVLAMKEANGKKTTDLESSAEGINVEMSSVQRQFEALVAAPC